MKVARNCYCNLWKKDPKALEDQGIPLGYCGICERCGKPGHVQHFPGPVPYTGTWCDHCVKIVPWTNITIWLKFIIPTLIISASIWYLFKFYQK